MIIVGFIIVIIAGILYLTFFNPWKKGTIREIHKQECKDSVRLSSLTQVKQYQFRPGIIECPIWEETIKGNPDSKKQSDRMKREIAQLMAEGWDVFGRGKLNLFESSGVYCSVYSIIDFEEKDKKIEDMLRGVDKDTPRNKMIVFLEDTDKFLDLTGNELGPFKKGDIANLPEEISNILISDKKAEGVDEE